MTFFDIHVLAAIKLISIVFVIGGYFFIKKKNPVLFLLWFGVLSAVSYILFVNDRQLLFWGLQGDELTIAAIYNTFAQVGFGADFAFHGFPPFYPPGFFWLCSIPGKIFGWNGIQIAKFAAASFFLVFPIGGYLTQRFMLKGLVSSKRLLIFSFLTPLIIMSVLGIDLLIGKPYEVLAAFLTVVWTIALFMHASQKKLSQKEILLFGVIAGLIFMTYYLWLVFAAIVFLLLFGVLKKNDILRYILNLSKVATIGIITALPFWGPLVYTYITVGMESWQTTFYTPENSGLWLPITQFGSSANIVLFLSFVSILWFFKKDLISKILLSFLGAAFIWWGFGLALLLFFSTPFQEFRGFYVLAPVVLSYGFAWAISSIWKKLEERSYVHLQEVVLYLGILLLIAHSIFGFFIDDPTVRKNMVHSKSFPAQTLDLAYALREMDHASDLVTLSTSPQLVAIFPINHYIYFNQHNTHPASIFSVRYQTVLSLSGASTPEEAYAIVTNAAFGPIDQFIFSLEEGEYVLYFHVDKPIEGIEEKRIVFNKDMFSDQYFEHIYEDTTNVVLQRKK
ncbi:MAG: hypothetical protein CO030_01930 [Candidatus Magasanikbacteria bacterium CG_4_9_14_0_2_um_filter_42_11]|uniref:Arabinofuranosyltransferase AftA N-terminal domain-containing protein n=1 Tax=Candidatus Magasanikbacteria bacterium CG_4_9_14_0_2_um_filter_42_11 TaxID=1974643 RepID=A0A2M8FA47_9BACT|nr:MAG: hypothetical protein COU34_00990 [Candidatus Magasanikbacteria bacterium CG10_big_fil_rev_8_21_14_0_10_43_9]PIY93057.1 MAG: hypothetical protein COY70_00025 [Candidatus Magasanikbacteria bacterium CG_4_10_14_0_8_um_filter_42_12]PJC52614.1 MAG: hypothetical protein CO030_01930 [Candidatus Magasanikbacteria bacterium CG_4_9_14_0_2_um_filter_42_11]